MKTIKYKHLSSEERDKIAVLRASNVKLDEISDLLGRNKSTISRELNRNRAPVYNVYLAYKAHDRARKRKQEAARRSRLKNKIIKRYVITRIIKGWSPEQISGRLPIDHPGFSISHESIYQFIYHPETRREYDLVPYLARSHKKTQETWTGQETQ